jgi:hypothetical protein
MKTKHQGSYKRSCPNIKNEKEKGLKLCQRLLVTLKTSVISFPLKTPQEARRHNFNKLQNYSITLSSEREYRYMCPSSFSE